jgi:hypothetical protein
MAIIAKAVAGMIRPGAKSLVGDCRQDGTILVKSQDPPGFIGLMP